jgi:hypothetical protein
MEANMFSALLVFNLGIVCHETSLLQGGASHSSASHAFKARVLYERSNQLLISVVVTTTTMASTSTGNVIVDLLHMSLLNNQAQLCVELSEYEKSFHLLKRLLRLALNVQATLLLMRGDGAQNDDEDGYHWMMQQVDSYLLNAVTAGICPFPAASAA